MFTSTSVDPFRNIRFNPDGGTPTGGAALPTRTEADIAPGNIPDQYPRLKLISTGGPVSLTVATEAGSVPDVWDKNSDAVWQGRTHSYVRGDVIMTYGPATADGKPIVDADGNQLVDRAVGRPDIIALTYKSFTGGAEGEYFNNGTTEFPELSIQPGLIVTGVKRAPLTVLLNVPIGTTIHSLETIGANKPPVTLCDGQVVTLGIKDEPWIQNDLAKVLSRNVPAKSDSEAETLYQQLKQTVSN